MNYVLIVWMFACFDDADAVIFLVITGVTSISIYLIFIPNILDNSCKTNNNNGFQTRKCFGCTYGIVWKGSTGTVCMVYEGPYLN